METVLKAISDWIKSLLTAAIMSNLSGLFDDVNTQVGNVAQQVGTKPSSFEPRVFAMIEALSRNVVLPIAGIILTFIACYELIEMITQLNNMAQFEPALLMKWILKTAISVWIYINKELQRVDVASLNALENKNVITRFPSLSSRCTTVQVLKSPKTDSSIRTIFLPKTVAEMLVEFKAKQDMTKEALGAEYTDYNLVVAGPLGMPTEQSTINGALKRLIEKNNLPKVVFKAQVFSVDSFNDFYLLRSVVLSLSLWHTKTPHFLNSIPYCLTNGVQFIKIRRVSLYPVPLLLQQKAEPTEQFLHRSFFQLLAKILQFQSTAHALSLLSLLQMLCTSLPLPSYLL